MASNEEKTMLNRTVLSLFLFVMMAGTGFTQTSEAAKSAEPLKFYKLEFTVKEVEGGKVVNTRSYSMTVAADRRDSSSSIRTGTRVPVPIGASKTQYQYFDLGVNIDCRSIVEMQGALSLSVTAEISSLGGESEPTAAGPTPAQPIVRQNKWSSSVIVPLKKPTVIFSSDDLTSKRQMQLELTAVPIK